MFPLTSAELPDLHLLTALNRGLLPDHYSSAEWRRSLDGYVLDYLREEVFAEGLVRNLPAFSRFFDAAALSHGELLNCAAVARDCGVDAKTVRAHFQILVDTLLGVLIEPFTPRRGRDAITRAPKFYFFDTGVAGVLARRTIEEERGEAFGRAFEHFLLMEILAHRSLSGLGYDVGFWRTKSRLEVDFVLGGGEVAVEVKGTDRVDRTELRGLRAFVEEQRPRKAIVVCNEPEPRRQEGIDVLPWREFLRRLWGGAILR
jgi:predicted AAA+ superfamily ATPase